MSSFSSRHSGGPNPIVSVCGKDGTAIYAKQHGSDTALIQGFFVATLQ
jgi:cytochrome b involved in lipid metabolism